MEPLRLVVADEDDLNVMSAALQDAVGKVGDFTYIPKERRFAAVLNRYRWEGRKRGKGERVRAGFRFDDVMAVKAKNVRLDAKDAVVSLLAVDFESGADGTGAVTLQLSGGGAIRLEVEALNAALEDLSDPWKAQGRPKHDAG